MDKNSKKSEVKLLSYFQYILVRSSPVISATWSLFIITIVFSTAGYYLDNKYNYFPIFFLLGLGIGLIIGIYLLFLTVKPKNKNSK